MAEEIDDNGFYREDFSAESDWEIFNAQLCELFQKWELSNSDWGRKFQPNELFQCNWKIDEELLDVKGNHVAVAYYRADLKPLERGKTKGMISGTTVSETPMHEDLLSLNNTFGPAVLDEKTRHIHWLARFYGLRRFVVLNPHSEQNSFITKRSEFSFYFSALSVVAGEICAAVPMFVQIYDQKWNFFLGLGITSYMRTNFDLVALEQPPQDYCYLSGLLAMFKEKLPKHCKQPALVSVRTTYALDTVKIRVPMYVPFGMTPLVDEDRSVISLSYFTALPHGYFPDSHTKIFAIFTWPELTDNMVIDSAIQTQFVPTKAPGGAIHQVVNANSYLTSCIKHFHNLITAKNMLESYVGRNFTGTLSPSELANPLEQLTKPHLGKFQAYRQMKRSDESGQQSPALKKLPGPMHEHELNQMLYYLFPDLHPDVALFPYETSDLFKDPHRIKSAVADSLVHRLSCLLATCNAHFGGKSGLAQLWATFTRELRLLWDCCIIIPGVASGFPDTRTCLLHQKLQMLNVCIERRLQREQGVSKVSKPQWSDTSVYDSDKEEKEDDNDTEEEFYDCDEDEANRSLSPVKGVEATKPEGRLKRLRDLKLLDSEEYLYVPITQEPVPKTEDQLQDDADVMLKLGTSSDHVTAMMCSTLQSDAEAFKAANLNACFEDFIRWYSPNDWEEYLDDQGDKQHRLSARMRAEGNTWQTVWEEAKPVPVSRQKRLFDDTNEAYKVLNYLETRNIGEIYGLTIVPLLHSTILKLKNIFTNSHVLELFAESLDDILAELSRFSRDIEVVAGSPSSTSSTTSNNETNYVLQLPNPAGITKKIEQLEMQYYQYECFKQMPQLRNMDVKQIQKKFMEILKNQGSCTITPRHFKEGEVIDKTAEVEECLMSSFKHDMQERLLSKDYVIRIGEGLTKTNETERDNENAKTVMPQFLRAVVTGEKLRLCGAFTENTTFLD
ncbi:rab3 GTPase-activating protein catalytic subunit [Lucilia sericata]|uniref:rab3 GTPase-activating protein catalytic subunit n=1 Tax=Lucilia sericata TaxID=13632 RepID=UPI0018A822AF|nr:rab3 GTPase-activating protein catalytic subunit [Lucilia sericata]